MKKTQFTPKGKEIPIPKRSDFLHALKKAATPEDTMLRRNTGKSQGVVKPKPPKSRNRPKK
jgi:hypothetical protein